MRAFTTTRLVNPVRPVRTRYNNETISLLQLQNAILWEHKNCITCHLFYTDHLRYHQFQSVQMTE